MAKFVNSLLLLVKPWHQSRLIEGGVKLWACDGPCEMNTIKLGELRMIERVR